jgi:hypothetical protein
MENSIIEYLKKELLFSKKRIICFVNVETDLGYGIDFLTIYLFT